MRFDRFMRGSAVAAALLGTLLVPRLVQAQAGTIRGTVLESVTRRGVPSARVIILGTGQGAITSDLGTYVLRAVPAGATTVRVQRIGFATAERSVVVTAGDSVTADFIVRPVAALLSEVVSVGYGSSSRANVSSAIASVTAEEIANVPLAGVDAALQGKMPGVQVVQNSGNPGNGISLRIRGPASINAGNQPLYVLDGVPVTQENFTQLGMGGQDITAISSLNPDEVESIDVLKDAAATAIYGSRGSNGVVLITTKRGRSGKTKITFNGYYGRQNTERTIGLLDAKQYVALMNESAKNDGYAVSDYDFVPGTDDANSYDWQGAVFRGAPVSDLQLAASGGSDRAQYYLSGSSFDQTGIVIGSRYKRQAGRVNLDFAATDKLLFRTSIGLTRENNDRIEGDGSLDGVLTNAIGMQPMLPVYGSSFGFAGDAEGLRYSNPVALATFNSTNLRTMRALGNVEGRYSFTDQLSLTGRVGADVLGVDELQWESPRVDGTYAASANGVGKSDHTNATKYLLESFLTASPRIGGDQQLSLIAGTSAEYNKSDLNFIRGEGFTSGFTKYVGNAANVTEFDGSATENNLVSYFTRVNYSLRDRYLLSASFRADGSSRFGQSNRWGYFPAASVGWLVSDEPFAASLARMATLKLRGSFGVTGNQGIGDFASLSTASAAPYSGTPGSAPEALGNPGLRWESTREFDGGMDLGLFGGRVSVIADYYHRHTSDLLVRRPISGVSGFTSIWDNVGAITNKGVDLGISTVNVQPGTTRGFGWTTDLNLTFNRNNVDTLYNNQPFTTGINGRETSIVAVGKPLGSFYMYQFQGVDPNTGDAIFKDIDGVPGITSADRTVVGNPHPKFYGGLTNAFTMRNFELRTFLQFSKGNDVFNMMRIFTDDGGCTYDNKSTVIMDRWQKAGDVTNVPRMSYDCVSGADDISSRFIEDGSYLRIGEVTLSYRLPNGLAARMGLDNARLSISGRNLHTFTKYTGYNPDVNSAGSDENVIIGTDYYAYPLARTFTFGISGGW